MKPAYEIVRADELRVGDVVSPDIKIKPYQLDHMIIDPVLAVVFYRVNGSSRQWHFYIEQPVFRQLTPERNPDVLMRALKKTCTRLRDIDWESNESDPSGFIEQAIRELESEAQNGQ